jgi:hypothetical protein
MNAIRRALALFGPPAVACGIISAVCLGLTAAEERRGREAAAAVDVGHEVDAASAAALEDR